MGTRVRKTLFYIVADQKHRVRDDHRHQPIDFITRPHDRAMSASWHFRALNGIPVPFPRQIVIVTPELAVSKTFGRFWTGYKGRTN